MVYALVFTLFVNGQVTHEAYLDEFSHMQTCENTAAREESFAEENPYDYGLGRFRQAELNGDIDSYRLEFHCRFHLEG